MEKEEIILKRDEYDAFIQLVEAAVRLLRCKQYKKPRGRRDGKRNG
jgi:hypothetical protein